MRKLKAESARVIVNISFFIFGLILQSFKPENAFKLFFMRSMCCLQNVQKASQTESTGQSLWLDTSEAFPQYSQSYP